MERLDCVVQDYAWGDPESIPELLGLPINGEPAAELWMGAHPKAPSGIAGADLSLDVVIAQHPDHHLGISVAERFGRLPYLFKVLAAAEPLSIQSHPTLTQAQAGFAREENAGIDIASPVRTYRDDNHKPELICALTPFVAKVGFKPLTETQALFAALTGIGPGADNSQPGPAGAVLAKLADLLHPDPETGDTETLRGVLEWLLRLDHDAATSLVADVLAAALACSDPSFSDELRWAPKVHAAFPGDIGGVVALLLNHVELQPGEAVFLGAGNLHAYLHGTGIELMANSDNVVRGGLTPKNIDLDELLAVVDTSPLVPEVQRPETEVHTYASPVPEFSLTRVSGGGATIASGPRIAIVVDGQFDATADTTTLTVGKGQVIYVPDSDGPLVLSGAGLAFVASPGIRSQ